MGVGGCTGSHADEMPHHTGQPSRLAAHPPGGDEIVWDNDEVTLDLIGDGQVGAEDIRDHSPPQVGGAAQVLTDADRIHLHDPRMVGSFAARDVLPFQEIPIEPRAERFQIADVDTGRGQCLQARGDSGLLGGPKPPVPGPQRTRG